MRFVVSPDLESVSFQVPAHKPGDVYNGQALLVRFEKFPFFGIKCQGPVDSGADTSVFLYS